MFKRRLIYAILWALIILVLSLLPGSTVEKVSFINIPHIDKFVHFLMYCILSILLVSYIRKKRVFLKIPVAAYLIVIFAAIIYGGIVEYCQRFVVSGRTSDYIDFIANSAGVISGLFIYFLLKKIFHNSLKHILPPD